MATADSGHVVGVFPTYARAEAAYQELRRKGITDENIRIGQPAPGRYRIEIREFEEMWHGAMLGVMIGVPVGALVAVGVLMTMVPDVASTGIGGIVLSVVVGGFWGIFFGGLAGVVPKVLAHEKSKHHYEITTDCAEAVVCVSPAANLGTARKVIGRGATCFLVQAPSTHPVETAAAA